MKAPTAKAPARGPEALRKHSATPQTHSGSAALKLQFSPCDVFCRLPAFCTYPRNCNANRSLSHWDVFAAVKGRITIGLGKTERCVRSHRSGQAAEAVSTRAVHGGDSVTHGECGYCLRKKTCQACSASVNYSWIASDAHLRCSRLVTFFSCWACCSSSSQPLACD